ncbi:MAG: tail-specific protease [Flavobacteriales bacterium]|nr:tail-specific protease [Flavobacteriales bacterium]
MRFNFLHIVALVAIILFGFSFSSKKFSDPNKEKLLIEVVKYVIEKGHYSSLDIDDIISEKIYNTYIEQLDAQKRFFLQSDIRQFEKYKFKLDDHLKDQDLTFFNLVYETSRERINEVKIYYQDIMSNSFDFSSNENINLDFENKSFARTKNEIKNRWRKQLKYSALDIISLKLGDTIKYIDDNIRNESMSLIKKNTDDFFDYITDMDRDDWFANYINAFLNQLDPHTIYFNPDDKDRFDTNISGKFHGIGARLQKTEGTVKIVDIIVGGPIWKDKLLDVGDLILKVAQENQDPVEIIGMKLDDAIKLIKGPADSYVTLTVKKLSGEIKEVLIQRGIVELEELYAKSTLINKGDKNYGYISLPKFYIDFEDRKSRNSANDVKNEIIKLKNNGISGLILDLRNNGGGALQTVVDMTGLFIKKGPIVQVKSTGNRKQVLYDKDPQVVWDGPLVVLMNKMSASASEILAGALQDYNRAVIIGNEKSFGKGTVQNVIDLNRFISNSSYDLGALKITTDKFYRINGESVQLEGVKSDIIIPDSYKYIFNGENDEKNPLKWDKIDPANFEKWSNRDYLNKLSSESQTRIDSDAYYSLINDRALWLKDQQLNKSISLNFSSYNSFLNKQREKNKKFESLNKYENNLKFKLLKAEKQYIQSDKELLSSRNRWHRNLTRDLYLEEGVKALEILSILNKNIILVDNDKQLK